MPMGVASMSFTRSMPSAVTWRTWGGMGLPAVRASSPGTRLSRIRVVLPEPETPVTTVSRPLGRSTSKGFTVWMASVAKRMRPSAKSSSGGSCRRVCGLALPDRKGPIREAGSSSSCRTVPWATTWPPRAPASGPISMIQSAWDRIWVSWSTSSTEFPSATRSSITAVRPVMLDGCRPMEGSSSTYSTPVVRFRTARASCIRCRSPVERGAADRSRVRYPSPRSISRRATVWKD